MVVLRILYVGIRKCKEHHWINHWRMICIVINYHWCFVKWYVLVVIILLGMGVCT
ncbi:unnamed protein product [Brassica oleracea var. botrytis]|uniref:(rape) hypothetical protein n=1 Tax=Brassica napus TaxID=3708 RepID=A0A816RLL9_BRANA|nr:unnamed protein product [Brassica napus]